jgi:hypothetical protein
VMARLKISSINTPIRKNRIRIREISIKKREIKETGIKEIK